MAIAADQKIDTGYDFTARQVSVPHPVTGDKSGFYMNIREDNNEVVGWTSERYGLVQHRDVIGFADNAFAKRNIAVDRKIYVTDGGAKMRAQYDLIGDQFKTKIPQVGDVVGYRLTAQNSLDRSLRIAYQLGILRLVCTNGMNTLEADVSMTKKHGKNVDLGDILSPLALDSALDKFKNSLSVYGELAKTEVSQEQGLVILQNLANVKVFSEKVRESIAQIWNNPSHDEDKARNLYNLNNAVTQHLTHDVAGERFEYANRVTSNVLKRFGAAARSGSRLEKLWTPTKAPAVTVSNN